MRALVTITFEDGDGDTSPLQVYVNVDDATTAADIVSLHIQPLYDQLTVFRTGKMISATISLMPDIFPFADLDPAAILSDVQEKAKFFFRT
jgi:hypothetical protein